MIDCEVVQDYNSYILNDVNMNQYLKYKFNETKEKNMYTQKDKNSISNNNTKQKTNTNTNTSSIFFPKDQDSLFWCYYIIINGDFNYEMLPNRNLVTTKQLKIQYISKIRENKSIIKTHKFDTISNIENNLANENISNIKSIMALLAIDNINIVFIRNKTYYELITNSTNDVYIITEQNHNGSKYVKKYGYEIATENKLDEIRNSLYKIDNLDKPIKSVSSYTASELLNIATKLSLQTTNISTGKPKTKNDLYELIVQYFYMSI